MTFEALYPRLQPPYAPYGLPIVVTLLGHTPVVTSQPAGCAMSWRVSFTRSSLYELNRPLALPAENTTNCIYG